MPAIVPQGTAGRQAAVARAAILGIEYMDIWGPVLIGCFLSFFFQGVFLAMALQYFQTFFRRDHWIVRISVIAVLLLTMAETAIIGSKTVKMLILNLGDFAYFLDIADRPEEWISGALAGPTIVICQAFMVWRCLSFARAMRTYHGRILNLLVWLLGVLLVINLAFCVIGSVGGPIAVSRTASYLDTVNIATGQSTGPVAFWFNFAICSYLSLDVIVSIIMTVQLRAARTGFGESNSVLDTMTNIIIRNGLFVTALQVTELILFRSINTAWISMPPLFLSRVYALTFISIITQPRIAQQQYQLKQEEESMKYSQDHVKVINPVGSAGSAGGLVVGPGGIATPLGTPAGTPGVNPPAYLSSGNGNGNGLYSTPSLVMANLPSGAACSKCISCGSTNIASYAGSTLAGSESTATLRNKGSKGSFTSQRRVNILGPGATGIIASGPNGSAAFAMALQQTQGGGGGGGPASPGGMSTGSGGGLPREYIASMLRGGDEGPVTFKAALLGVFNEEPDSPDIAGSGSRPRSERSGSLPSARGSASSRSGSGLRRGSGPGSANGNDEGAIPIPPVPPVPVRELRVARSTSSLGSEKAASIPEENEPEDEAKQKEKEKADGESNEEQGAQAEVKTAVEETKPEGTTVAALAEKLEAGEGPVVLVVQGSTTVAVPARAQTLSNDADAPAPAPVPVPAPASADGQEAPAEKSAVVLVLEPVQAETPAIDSAAIPALKEGETSTSAPTASEAVSTSA